MRRRTIVLIVLAIVFISAWIPFPSVVVPKWRVRVVDVNNVPCAKQTVDQSWAHYSLWDETNSDYQKTDAEGFVEFPERTITRNLIQRIVYPPLSYLGLIITAHADVGISAYVGASEPVNSGVFGLKYDWKGALPDRLIIKRCFVDHDIPEKAS